MCYFKGLKKQKTQCFTRLLRSKSHLIAERGGITRHAPLPVLTEGRGEKSFPRKVFIVKPEAFSSREMPAESAHRADWPSVVSHIYLEFLLAQGPRWVGSAVRCPLVREGRGGAAKGFPRAGAGGLSSVRPLCDTPLQWRPQACRPQALLTQ